MPTRRSTLGLLVLLLVSVVLGGAADSAHSSPSILPDGRDIARALAAQERTSELLLALDGVVGTGVGADEDGRAVVKVFAESAAVAGVPAAFDGVPVEIEIAGRIRARVDATGRFARPIPTGVSTGHRDVGAGTIGARVTKDGNVYALSNNHVFANSGVAAIGDSLLQPAVTDGGQEPEDVFATLAEFAPIDFSPEGDNVVDAAIGLTSEAVLAAATPEDGYGSPSTTTVPAFVGQAVKKYGRTTGLTSGIVEAVNVSIEVCYDEFFFSCVQSATFENQIAIADTVDAFSLGGDSGSLIVTDDEANNPVGLLFAGGGDTTFANPIDAVLAAFDAAIDPAAVAPPEDGTPEGPTADALYLVLQPTTVLGAATFEDEDVALFDGTDFSIHFDGSDVGLGNLAIDGISVPGPRELLISLSTAGRVPGVGPVDDSDILLFTATSLGVATSGAFSMYLDGSDVGLTRRAEDIDALDLLPDGRVVVSTRGPMRVAESSGADEDLAVFTPTTRGFDTTGTWARYFDGSDVGLGGSGGEDIDGAAIASDDVYLSTLGAFSVTGLSGADEDIFRFAPATRGAATTGTFAELLELDGSAFGLEGSDVVALDVAPAAAG